MSFVSMLAPVSDDMRRVDEVIGRRLESDVPLVREVAQYIVASGGKRLRPAVLLLAAGAAGHRGAKAPLHDLAAVLEFIHTATLLHDDVGRRVEPAPRAQHRQRGVRQRRRRCWSAISSTRALSR
jgi:octaprenyl-diphosphate synthase